MMTTSIPSNSTTLNGLESSFRHLLSQDFKSFKTLEIYKKLAKVLISDLIENKNLETENKLWKLVHYKIINEYRQKIKTSKVN